MFNDIKEKIVDYVATKLEKHDFGSWLKSWTSKGGASGMPVNATTGNVYQGVNILLLWGASDDHGFETNEFATFQQWMQKKEFVKKGSKGTMIIYYDKMLRPDKNDPDEVKEIPFIKVSYVFNRCQLQSYKPSDPEEPKPLENRIEAVDTFIKNTGAVIEHGGNKACYIPSLDKIMMPPMERFIDLKDATAQESYYGVLFHELTHWTGKDTRLDRLTGGRFGTDPYAREELTAEFGKIFLCAEKEITHTVSDNSVAYMGGWAKKIREEKGMLIKAASEASKSNSYLDRLVSEQTACARTH